VDVGDRIHILGHTTDFEQTIGVMQIEHQEVRHANAGDDVGIKVVDHVREHDKVYRTIDVGAAGAGQHDL
jgi:putative protease